MGGMGAPCTGTGKGWLDTRDLRIGKSERGGQLPGGVTDKQRHSALHYNSTFFQVTLFPRHQVLMERFGPLKLPAAIFKFVLKSKRF